MSVGGGTLSNGHQVVEPCPFIEPRAFLVEPQALLVEPCAFMEP